MKRIKRCERRDMIYQAACKINNDIYLDELLSVAELFRKFSHDEQLSDNDVNRIRTIRYALAINNSDGLNELACSGRGLFLKELKMPNAV